MQWTFLLLPFSSVGIVASEAFNKYHININFIKFLKSLSSPGHFSKPEGADFMPRCPSQAPTFLASTTIKRYYMLV